MHKPKADAEKIVRVKVRTHESSHDLGVQNIALCKPPTMSCSSAGEESLRSETLCTISATTPVK